MFYTVAGCKRAMEGLHKMQAVSVKNGVIVQQCSFMIGKSRLFGRGNRDFLIGEIATSPSGQRSFAWTADHRPNRDGAIDIAIGPMKFFSRGLVYYCNIFFSS